MSTVVFASLVGAAMGSDLNVIAERVSALNTTWTAEAPGRFASIDEVKRLLGAIMPGDERFKPTGRVVSKAPANVTIPSEFDVRSAFPACAELSSLIGDQSACGDCWAYSGTKAFNDRHCIATGSKIKLSATDTAANCGFLQCFSHGCAGGQPGWAWSWFKSKGVVTGGDYVDIGTGSSCAPYSLAPCAHHVPATEKYPACPTNDYRTPSLKTCTESGYAGTYSSDKVFATDHYVLDTVEAIQADILLYGSATAGFDVYDDFPTYKSGVYKHTPDAVFLGGHVVKILGWGTENGEDYWLMANSWNELWGDHGTFKIARGTNECAVEGLVFGGRAGSSIVV